MSEPTGEDFARLLGRSPEPEQEAEQKPDKPPAEQAETEPEVDPLIAALTQSKSSWAESFIEAMHGSAEAPAEQEREPEPIDFDGGARKPMPEERDAGEAHGAFLLALLGRRPQGGGGQW